MGLVDPIHLKLMMTLMKECERKKTPPTIVTSGTVMFNDVKMKPSACIPLLYLKLAQPGKRYKPAGARGTGQSRAQRSICLERVMLRLSLLRSAVMLPVPQAQLEEDSITHAYKRRLA